MTLVPTVPPKIVCGMFVAVIVPVPVAASDAPLPTNIAAVVLVAPVTPLNATLVAVVAVVAVVAEAAVVAVAAFPLMLPVIVLLNVTLPLKVCDPAIVPERVVAEVPLVVTSPVRLPTVMLVVPFPKISCPAVRVPEFVTVPVVAAEQAGTPAVEMAFRNWLALQVRDSTPPRVAAVGAGILAAGTVPLARLLALSAVSPAPLPVKELLALENVSALLYVPLKTADGTVPLARLLALREVSAEPFPECVPVKVPANEFDAFENVFCPVMVCTVVRST